MRGNEICVIVAALILQIAVAVPAAALSQPRGQNVTVTNQCAHSIVIRTHKRPFSPWHKPFDHKTLASGDSISETLYFCTLFSCKEKPLPEFVFYDGQQRRQPFLLTHPRNYYGWNYEFTVCPEKSSEQVHE